MVQMIINQAQNGDKTLARDSARPAYDVLDTFAGNDCYYSYIQSTSNALLLSYAHDLG